MLPSMIVPAAPETGDPGREVVRFAFTRTRYAARYNFDTRAAAMTRLIQYRLLSFDHAIGWGPGRVARLGRVDSVCGNVTSKEAGHWPEYRS